MAKVKLTAEMITPDKYPNLFTVIYRMLEPDDRELVVGELNALFEVEIKKALKHSRALTAAQGKGLR